MIRRHLHNPAHTRHQQALTLALLVSGILVLAYIVGLLVAVTFHVAAPGGHWIGAAIALAGAGYAWTSRPARHVGMFAPAALTPGWWAWSQAGAPPAAEQTLNVGSLTVLTLVLAAAVRAHLVEQRDRRRVLAGVSRLATRYAIGATRIPARDGGLPTSVPTKTAARVLEHGLRRAAAEGRLGLSDTGEN